MTSHEIMRQLVFGLSNDGGVSEVSDELLQKEAESVWTEAERIFKKSLNRIADESVREQLHDTAYAMAYAYGDLYGEKGIRFGMRFVMEEVLKSEKNP